MRQDNSIRPNLPIPGNHAAGRHRQPPPLLALPQGLVGRGKFRRWLLDLLFQFLRVAEGLSLLNRSAKKSGIGTLWLKRAVLGA